MVSSGLTQFDDLPQSYWAWKTSFQSITHDLNLTAREELDLLVKWLGPESAAQADSVTSPPTAVQIIWERLENCYGCAEVIEHALLKRLEDFPRISNKDLRQLRELGDLLQELEAAKRGGLTPGLAYLDTARGVNPIVENFSHNLQEKWVSQGSRYKEDYKVALPPFRFFVQFVCNQAKTSFIFSWSSCATKADRVLKVNYKPSVFVKRTEVSASTAQDSSQAEKAGQEPNKHCPIHNKPHPFFKCRAFRNKLLDERKSFLKDNSICYWCCASTKHMAKDCKVSVRCRECDSNRHVSALHPGPAPCSMKRPRLTQNSKRSSLTSHLNALKSVGHLLSAGHAPKYAW